MQDLQPWQDLYWQRRIKARVNESLQSILGSESCTDQWPPLHWSGARLRKMPMIEQHILLYALILITLIIIMKISMRRLKMTILLYQPVNCGQILRPQT